jgi:hypothetical protein
MRNEVIQHVASKYTRIKGFPPILLGVHQIPYYGSLIQFISNRTDNYVSTQRYIHKQTNTQSEITAPATDRRKRRKGVASYA